MANLLAKTEDASPSLDDLLYLVNDPNGTPADRKATLANVLGANVAALRALAGSADKGAHFTGAGAMATHDFTSHGRTLLGHTNVDSLRAYLGMNDWRLLPINKTANYTAAQGDFVLCDATGGSFTITLPLISPGILPSRVAVKLTATSGANKVTVARPLGGSINGAAVDVDLLVGGDYVWLVNTGAGAWHVIAEKCAPHAAAMEASVAVTVPASTWTLIGMDTAPLDTCGLVDLVNDRITIRRSGYYDVLGYGHLDTGSSGIPGGPALKVNGAFVSQNQFDNAGQSYNGVTAKRVSLAAGDYVQLFFIQQSGGTRTTSTSSVLRPHLSVVGKVS